MRLRGESGVLKSRGFAGTLCVVQARAGIRKIPDQSYVSSLDRAVDQRRGAGCEKLGGYVSPDVHRTQVGARAGLQMALGAYPAGVRSGAV